MSDCSWYQLGIVVALVDEFGVIELGSELPATLVLSIAAVKMMDSCHSRLVVVDTSNSYLRRMDLAILG